MDSDRSRPDIEQLTRLYRSGLTIAAVAAEVGYSSSWVFNQLVAAGIARRPSAAAPKTTNSRRRPTIDEVTALYGDGWTLDQIGDHFNYSGAWVRNQLIVAGIDRRPIGHQPGTRIIDDAAEADMVRRICSLYVDEQLPVAEIARRFDRSSWWVKDRLTRTGVATRSTKIRPTSEPSAEQLQSIIQSYVDDRHTIVDIATRIGRSPQWVSAQLRGAGVDVAPGGARRMDVDAGWIAEQYVDHRRSLNSISIELGISADVIKRVLDERNIARRSRSESLTRITDSDELRRLYVDERLTQTEIAQRLAMSSTGVANALHRHGIPIRRPGSELSIGADELRRHVVDGLTNEQIAERHGVATWAVTRRLRRNKIRRPHPTPYYTRPSPPVSELRSMYIDDGASLADIATHYGVPHPTVGRWLDNHGIERRTGRYTPNPGKHPLDTDMLRELYIDEEWTSTEIAEHVGVTSRVVLDHLHRHGIPTRPSGAKRPGRLEPLLRRLYNDTTITEFLARHNVPIEPTPGPLRTRFPNPTPLSAELVAGLYSNIGLSVSQISLLTGHHDNAIRVALQQAGTQTRSGHSRAPWTQRS